MKENLRAAIVQDDESGEILMLGWMDEEAYTATLDTGLVHFFSRSRQQLWQKGETSGNTLALRSVVPDCDNDAVVIRAVPNGPTCHDGTSTCFAPWLWRKIVQRKNEQPTGSYVAQLLQGGTPAIAQKVGEEATEVVVAALSESDERVVSEVADLWFHTLTLLASRNIDLTAVEAELRRRDR